MRLFRATSGCKGYEGRAELHISNSQFIRLLHPKCGGSVNLYKDSTKRSHDSKSISLNLFLGEFGSLDVSNEPTLYTGSTVKCYFKPGLNLSCRYNDQHPIQTSLKPPAATCIEYFSNWHKTCLRSWSACSFSTTQAHFLLVILRLCATLRNIGGICSLIPPPPTKKKTPVN